MKAGYLIEEIQKIYEEEKYKAEVDLMLQHNKINKREKKSFKKVITKQAKTRNRKVLRKFKHKNLIYSDFRVN